MLLDSLLRLSDTQALTTTAISNNVWDTGPLGGAVPAANAGRLLGSGEELHLTLACRATFTSGGAPTLTATLESSAAAGLTSPTVHWTSAANIALATLVNGFWIADGIPLPPGDYLRFIGIRYTIATAAYTGGTVDAWIHKGRIDRNRNFGINHTTGFGTVPTV